jgi:uncharacterized protein (UPF0335 family)
LPCRMPWHGRKPDDVAEEEAVLDLYKTALGMA